MTKTVDFWKKRFEGIAADIGKDIQQNQVLVVAGSLAYTTILSIVPLLAVSLALFKAFGGLDKILVKVQGLIVENLAQGANEMAYNKLQELVGGLHAATLGISGMIGLIITSMAMLSSVEKAILRVWNEKSQRSVFQRFATYWFFITLGPVLLAVVIGITTSTTMRFTSLLPPGIFLWLLATAGFFGLYKWIPTRHVHWGSALASAGIAALSWTIARALYALYVKNFVNYDKLYGSLGAIPILLLWIWILWVIILSGASLTASIQRRLDLK